MQTQKRKENIIKRRGLEELQTKTGSLERRKHNWDAEYEELQTHGYDRKEIKRYARIENDEKNPIKKKRWNAK